ncbi:hypothetical protein Cni_G15548 [Canna indica]|uniref:Uncharacterized protein n=1 Tax=Canna indica TaxID=4628 RepID=A0AAQ3KEM4_9LILI|nr:hypothetical protein Cni_G15548 [Canna indica]
MLSDRIEYRFEQWDNWRNEAWLEEGGSADNKKRKEIVGLIATGFWFLWKNKNEWFFKKKGFRINILINKVLIECNKLKIEEENKGKVNYEKLILSKVGKKYFYEYA